MTIPSMSFFNRAEIYAPSEDDPLCIGFMQPSIYRLNDGGHLGLGIAALHNPRAIYINFVGKSERASKYGLDAQHQNKRGISYIAIETRGKGHASNPLGPDGRVIPDEVIRRPDGSRICYDNGNGFGHDVEDGLEFLQHLFTLNPHIPIIIAGHSQGGTIAGLLVKAFEKLKIMPEWTGLKCKFNFDSPMNDVLFHRSRDYSLISSTLHVTSFAFKFAGRRSTTKLVPGGFPTSAPFELNPLTNDRTMYDALRKEELNSLPQSNWGTSLGWIASAIKSVDEIHAYFGSGGKTSFPVTMVHGDKDKLAPLASSEKIATAIGRNCEFIVIKGGMHQLSICSPDIRQQRWNAFDSADDAWLDGLVRIPTAHAYQKIPASALTT